MIRLIRGVSVRERQTSTELQRRTDGDAIGDVMRRCKLRWHGHVEHKGDADRVKTCIKFVVGRTVPIIGQ